MRRLFVLFFCLISLHLHAQEQQLAYQYYRNGEYEKAIDLFQSLHETNPYNTSYTNYLIDCYQQLEKFEAANILIHNQLKKLPNQDYQTHGEQVTYYRSGNIQYSENYRNGNREGEFIQYIDSKNKETVIK